MDESDLGTMYDFVGKTPQAWADCILFWLGRWRTRHEGIVPEVLVPVARAAVLPLLVARQPGLVVMSTARVKPAYFCIRERRDGAGSAHS